MIEPSSFEQEHELDIPIEKLNCKAISGYANFVGQDPDGNGGPAPAANAAKGDPGSDTQWISHEFVMVVGPEWKELIEVSPSVTLAGYSFDDSDEADDSGYHFDSCAWQPVDIPSFQPPVRRIELRCTIRVRGGTGFAVTKVAYQLIALGVI